MAFVKRRSSEPGDGGRPEPLGGGGALDGRWSDMQHALARCRRSLRLSRRRARRGPPGRRR
jgi:hypothetical protein